VVRTAVVALPDDATRERVSTSIGGESNIRHQQRLIPVIDHDRKLTGVVSRRILHDWDASRRLSPDR